MPPRRARGHVPALLAACVLAASARAQVAPNRAARYLATTDVTDARALWVNPAGLALYEEASLNADVTVGSPGPGGRLEQLTLGVVSRGLAFGYQRDVFAAGVRGHTYRLGYAVGRNGFAAAVAAALYRGGSSSSGWDAGVLDAVGTNLVVGGVIANLGQPVVRGVTLPVTYGAGATLRVLDARAALSADARFTSAGALGYAFGARATLGAAGRAPLGLLARLDTDRGLRRTALAFGISLGGADEAGLVGTTPGDVTRLDALSVYGVSTRRFAGPRTRVRG
ncbi:MAG TPA: hypothetical protein VM736_02125 [Gemmatimonadales bacterium]|nr:hypothetical protein [Gemmatimonadales bacterium]